MFELTFLGVTISIDLAPGIYVFPNMSASGKTYLHDLLRQAGVAGYAVSTYTYNDFLEGRDIMNVFRPEKYKVILVDRYDMFEGNFVEEINKCKDNSVVLIDYKGKKNWFDTDSCAVLLSEGKIEVLN